MTTFRIIFLVGSMLSSMAVASSAQEPSFLKTKNGVVQGIHEDEVYVYKGIPFAAPPVGNLRWRPPQPEEPWADVRSALQFGDYCPQNAASIFPDPPGNMSEDCLTLNIWTPSANVDARLPVMVWIYGGGYVNGSGSLSIYDGTALAKQDVVLISINYRLGVLGFFAHPALSQAQAGEPLGNYGLMDQIAALEWVKENVAAFGGDPNNVTIFGESAGAGSVNYLMVATTAKGLFHRAISQSSSAGLQPEPEMTRPVGRRLAVEEQGEVLASLLGLDQEPDVIAALREVSVDKFLDVTDRRVSPRPLIDGLIITDRMGILFSQGRQHDVPYLAGGNSWEASLGHAVGAGMSPALRARSMSPDIAATLYKGLDESQAIDQWFGDSHTWAPTRYLTSQMSNVTSPAYIYFMSYLTESRRGIQPGVAHGDEIAYVFQTLDRFYDDVSERDRGISEMISAYWVHFAKTGNPNGDGRPNWPEYRPDQQAVLEIGDEIKVVTDFLRARLDFHEKRGLEDLLAAE